MKKTVLAFLLIFVTLSVFAQNGVLRELSGTVELKNAGASSFIAANVGDQLRQDTIISTGFKSTALVEVGCTLIAVRPLTRLTLTEISASSGSETLNVNLAAGRVRVDVNPPAGTRASMSVTSPSATASVRGTSFDFNLYNVKVLQGIVGMSGNQGYGFLVTAGNDGKLGLDGGVLDPVAAYLASLKPKAPVGSGTATGTDDGDSADNVAGTTVTDSDSSVNVGLYY